MRKFRLSLVMVLVLGLLVSCAFLRAKPYAEMTQQEKVLYALKTYNAQYTDYLNVASQPKITEAQKATLKVKKQVLTELWPMINKAKSALDEGKPVELMLLSQIGNLINKLLTGI